MSIVKTLLAKLRVNPQHVSHLYPVGSKSRPGFRFPAPGSQPQPIMPETPEINPATAVVTKRRTVCAVPVVKMSIVKTLLAKLRVNPQHVSHLYPVGSKSRPGFRFPAPGSQPQPIMPETPEINPATAVAKNPYYKRAAKPRAAEVISGADLAALAKVPEKLVNIGQSVSWTFTGTNNG
eukprot:TRINITY_DN65_c0_g1_i1.p1 TRINITY_DN65_c0_g1~~TRINITY_DN65_c0_g1_i1.p1  ORF type:complete len:200 (-),score=26.88 TRINITY_DN65_c0_g1_i1:18-554(-)